MNENYYRELIDKVNQNEKAMWERNEDSNERFEDFEKLWGILSDENADVSAETYMEAVDLCMTSFFGAIQNRKTVWNNIIDHCQKALNDSAEEEEFREAFMSFAETYLENEDPECVEQFTKMMRMAIIAEDAEMAKAVMTCAFCYDIWSNENDYPEWSVWLAVFSDKDFSEIPHSPKVTETIEELYSKLGDDPTLDRLRELYDIYM